MELDSLETNSVPRYQEYSIISDSGLRVVASVQALRISLGGFAITIGYAIVLEDIERMRCFELVTLLVFAIAQSPVVRGHGYVEELIIDGVK